MRGGLRAILKGPSIYDIARKNNSSSLNESQKQSQNTSNQNKQEGIKKKPSLYDMILMNSHSKEKINIIKTIEVILMYINE